MPHMFSLCHVSHTVSLGYLWYFQDGGTLVSKLPTFKTLFAFVVLTLGTLSIDNEMHDDDVRNPRRIGSRVSFFVGKRKVK